MELFLIDAIGPFFRDYGRRRINWSKIPFEHLALDEPERRVQFDRIAEEMAVFTQRVCAIGYNAVSLDDVAHLADHPWYEEEHRRTVQILQEEFRRIFGIIRNRGLAIYLTMDILSFTPALRAYLGRDYKKITSFIVALLEGFFRDFPEVSGVILRVGESDGRDVKGLLRSELCIRRPNQLNYLLRTLLPLFEREGRRLILRNWTVGAYSIGDFIWHGSTLARVLEGINSPAFVLSMKYGESDFFRYLHLNSHFFDTGVQKIVELQARREYEGCGEYPSFIGGDYARYARELARADNMLGISVWCQTGGWLPFRRLAFLDRDAVWTEINAYVCVQLFRERVEVEEALRHYCIDHGVLAPEALLELLFLSEQVVKELLYVPEYARQQLFFRRVRIPPLLAVYWNTLFINHSMRKLMRHFVRDQRGSIADAHKALAKIERMIDLATKAAMPVADIHFMKESFSLFVLAREYYFLPYTPEMRTRIRQAKKRYKTLYPPGSRYRYRIKTSFKPLKIKRRYLGWLANIIFRKKPGYRLLDRLLFLRLLSVGYFLLHRARPKILPKFARKNAMGLDTVFK
ncbi:MAG: hypothetical protein GX087_06745 [Desulfobulbaceae bacterium]|nr:hypothetical protein [Desulfobulbaceae bacterium]